MSSDQLFNEGVRAGTSAYAPSFRTIDQATAEQPSHTLAPKRLRNRWLIYEAQ